MSGRPTSVGVVGRWQHLYSTTIPGIATTRNGCSVRENWCRGKVALIFFFFYHDTGVCSDRVILPDSFTTPNNLEYRQPSSHRFTNSMLLYHQVLPNMKTV